MEHFIFQRMKIVLPFHALKHSLFVLYNTLLNSGRLIGCFSGKGIHAICSVFTYFLVFSASESSIGSHISPQNKRVLLQASVILIFDEQYLN